MGPAPTSWDGSMKLDSVIAEYLDHYKLTECYAVRAGIVGSFSSERIFGWRDLNLVLSSSRLTPPRLRFAHQDIPNDELNAFYTETVARRGISIPHIDGSVFHNLLRRGATLVLDAVDEFDPQLREIVRSYARTFISIPQVNLYACFGDDPGFGLHWDDHDVFIFQVGGRKHWKIYGPTREAPCYKDVESPPALSGDVQPYFDQVIEPGQILYVPRGHWHDVLGINEPSLHLTLGITHPTASDLLFWLADDLKTHPEVRRDLPLFDREMQKEAADSILALLNQRFTNNVIHDYVAYRASMLHPKFETSLPSSITHDFHDDDIVRWLTVVEPVRNEDGTVTITARGMATTFSEPVGILAEIIYSSSSIHVGSLRERCTEAGQQGILEKVLTLFLDKGIIAVWR